MQFREGKRGVSGVEGIQAALLRGLLAGSMES